MQASSASSSIQDPSDHAVLPPVEPVALGQTELDVDEPTVLEVLTDFPEATFERGDLPVVSELPAEHAERADQHDVTVIDPETRPEVVSAPPDWCVDQGDTITAMTTFELWMALARGDLDSQTRVWGNGMDNWELVADIPELAHAMKDTFSLAPPPPLVPTPISLLHVRGHDRTPLGFGTTDAANDDFPAESGPVARHWKGLSSGRLALVAGTLAVAAAVGLTIVPQTTDTSAQAAGKSGPVAVARLQSAMERANRQVDEATHRRMETEAARAVEPVTTTSRHHRDVGQRRVRRGHH